MNEASYQKYISSGPYILLKFVSSYLFTYLFIYVNQIGLLPKEMGQGYDKKANGR